MSTTIDEARLEELMHTLVGYMTGGAMCMGMWMGDELGLYRALSAAGPISANDVAQRCDCQPRLVREWLDGQVAAGLVTYHDVQDAYSLSPEAAMALADDSSPAFVARAMNAVGSVFLDFDKVVAAFRGDGALAWGDHDPCLFAGTEWFFRPGYRAYLPEWIAALGGVEAKLAAGGAIADIGCGHGASAIVMARAYPDARVVGFDYHPPSVDAARERAVEAGVGKRAKFEVADAKGYEGTYDLVCFFDCLHDMGDPVGVARYARDHLAPGGSVLLVEPFALDARHTNLEENPLAAMLYTISSVICTPNSLSQEVGLGLGAQAGAERLRMVFEDAGYSRFRKVTETPLNLILEARA